jgi:hypothetical protein
MGRSSRSSKKSTKNVRTQEEGAGVPSGGVMSALKGLGRAMNPTAMLRSMAGLAGDVAPVEQLERREYMFALTITADSVDPNTGLGTATAQFAYFLPYLQNIPDVSDQQTPTVRNETFQQVALGNIASPTVLAQTGIRIDHTVAPANDFRFAGDPNDQNGQVRWIRANPSVGEIARFSFLPANTQGGNNNTFIPVDAAQFTIDSDFGVGDTTGLVPNQFTVRVLLRGALVQTLTGAALQAAIQGASPANGVGVLTINPPGQNFDQVVFERTGNPNLGDNAAFRITQIQVQEVLNRFGAILQSREAPATLVLTGPVGATVNVTDLYGRDMRQTLLVARVPGGDANLVPADANADGIPEFNDGIGALRVTGGDSRTAISIFGAVGGLTAFTDNPPDDADYVEATVGGGFAIVYPDGLTDSFDEFESTAGFGYAVDVNNGTVNVGGLPTGPGSVVIGSPFVRPLNDYRPGGRAAGQGNTVTDGFANPDQGLFVTGSIGSVQIHGAVHGSSTISGFADRFYASLMLGSLAVEGDLGLFAVASDAGQWVIDPDFTFSTPGVRVDPVNKTGSQLTVGRSLGSYYSGGRGLTDITVLGDLNDPINRPARNVSTYYEMEYVFGINPDADAKAVLQQWLANNNAVGELSTSLVRAAQQPIPLPNGSYARNNTLATAEFIGGSTTGVRILGDLSAADPSQSEDTNDVYAFVADGTQPVSIQATNDSQTQGVYFRVVDSRGRTIAAPRGNDGTGRFQISTASFVPDEPGVYYLVVTDPNGADTQFNVTAYTISITGLAPVTFGSYRSAGGSGFTDQGTGEGQSITILNGSMGSFRVGMGLNDGAGAEVSPAGFYNVSNQLSDDDSLAWGGGSLTVPGNLYNISAGGDIGSPDGNFGGGNARIDVRVNGNLGSIVTGLSNIVGAPFADGIEAGNGEGDVNFLFLTVGGSISSIDISGGIGMDQDLDDPLGRVGANFTGLNIRTGTEGLPGNIGRIRTGFHVGGDTVSINLGEFGTIGYFGVAQGAAALTAAEGDARTTPIPGEFRSGVYEGLEGIRIQGGAGSNVKFFDVPRLDLINGINAHQTLIGDQELVVTDDGGATVRIRLSNGPVGTPVGRVRLMPVDGSRGTAIAAIELDAVATGGTLIITTSGSTGASSVGIGRINWTGAGPGSTIELNGTVKTDVYLIESPGTFDDIRNLTPQGDIVAIDVAGIVNSVEVRGNLGSTNLPAWGPKSIGPDYGVATDAQGGVRGALGFTAPLDNDFNGTVYRPFEDDTTPGGNAYLDDIGGPFDGRLNGLVVRGGNVNEVRVNGSVGDVLLLGGGTLTQLLANADRVTAFGGFDGIVGTIFATDINRIELGDGLIGSGDQVLARAGIFAADDINEVTGTNEQGAIVTGVISASNVNQTDNAGGIDGVRDGINAFRMLNGVVENAVITAGLMDQWWKSFFFTEVNPGQGDIGDIQLLGTNLSKSFIGGVNLGQANIDGSWDASQGFFSGNIGQVRAIAFQNSSLGGSTSEQLNNRLIGGGEIRELRATRDISDFTLDVLTRSIDGINAANIIRSTIEIDGEVRSITTTGDIVASRINLGSLQTLTVGRNLNSSFVGSSGPMNSITVTGSATNTEIFVSDVDGLLGTATFTKGFDGTITSTGPVTSIAVPNGDLVGTIRTATAGALGNVGSITASGDVAVIGDIGGNLQTLTAGKNIGRVNQGVLSVRGNLGAASAPNGTLHSDLRVGGSVTTPVLLGSAVAFPGNNQVGKGSIVANGSVAGVTVNGDFDGDIISYGGGIASVAINNGSFWPNNIIAAYDGDLTSVVVTNGNLYGNVYAERDITLLRVVADAAGVFGDVGISRDRSQYSAYDNRRNMVPPGVDYGAGFNGPRITAGRDVVLFDVTNGNVYEAGVWAGRNLQTVTINGRVGNNEQFGTKGSFFAAGDTVNAITVTQNIADTTILSGLVSLGADDALGGTGANADTIKAGSISTVTTPGMYGVTVLAGVDAGLDGYYGDNRATAANESLDDTLALGVSTINTLAVSAAVSETQVYGDVLSAAVRNDSRFVRYDGTFAGEFKPLKSFTLDDVTAAGRNPGTLVSGTRTLTVGGQSITVTVAGPGRVYIGSEWDARRGRLGLPLITLENTTSATSVTVGSSAGSLSNLGIVSNDDASLGTLRVTANLTGDYEVTVDGGIGTVNLADTTPSGTDRGAAGVGNFNTGGDVATFTANTLNGVVSARAVNAMTVAGATTASVQLLNLGTLSIAGLAGGRLSVEREISTISMTGGSRQFRVRAGGSIGSITAPTIQQSVFSAGNNIGAVSTTGDVFDSSFSAGADLGRDASFGGTGLNEDRVSAGSIASVTVGGNFRESDVTAGVLRGADGFFGTSDDAASAGKGSIGPVTITGTQAGSTRSSESYRVISNGSIGTVRLGGQTLTGTTGNFGVESIKTTPSAIEVIDLRTSVASNVFSANIVFNQEMEASSISGALTVSEVRGSGDVEIRLIEGTDYTVSYDRQNNAAVIRFSNTVTTRNLPQIPGKPGPGIYRIKLSQDLLRAKLDGVRLDGNGDGYARVGDDYSEDTIIGDAGDKLTPGTTFTGTGNTTRVDFYGPTSLDIVLDSNATSDGLPDANREFTIRGFIGDHPDQNINFFRAAGDVDLYSITLQAGQILRLGALTGNANAAGLSVFDPSGAQLNPLADAANTVSLPTQQANQIDIGVESAFLIKVTGRYVIAVGNTTDIAATNTVTNPNITPNSTGAYSFDLQVFDDGDSGFTSTTNSGDGTNVVSAPLPIDFAGFDGTFGTGDDRSTIEVDGYVFTLNRGTDNAPNTADDLVSGTNGVILSTRTGTGVVKSVISASIGDPGKTGVPGAIQSDVDIFHLNGRNPIAPGTKLRVTMQLAGLGSDLGSSSPGTIDNRGSVQFGLFDTTGSTGVDDATLIFSPTDFSPNGGPKNKVIADDGSTKYGYNADGDFYIEFVTPDRIGAPGQSGTFALYVQGVYRTDYKVLLENIGTGTRNTAVQNFYIETGGGSVDWLEAGGRTTNLLPFDFATLGFVGTTADSTPVGTYAINQLVASLNSIYQGAGYNVRFSTNAADFEFQQFSTIFLSSSPDPIVPLFNSFTNFNINAFLGNANANQAFVSTNPFGFAEHSDILNADKEDDAVVFAPAFSLQGFTPSQADLDEFVQALTGSVSRRAGELLGLRVTANQVAGSTTFDPFAANSVETRPGTGNAYSIPNFDRSLSTLFDSVERTNFFLGNQNAASLLDKIISRI